MNHRNGQPVISRNCQSSDTLLAHDDVDGSSMSITKRTNVVALSLGGGVQSTVLALLLDRGLLPGYPKPDLGCSPTLSGSPAGLRQH